MLGDDVGKQHVARTARCGRYAGLDPVLCRRGNVWSADSGVVAAEKRADQVVEPVRIGHAIAVGINNDVACGLLSPDISREAQALIFLSDIDYPGMPCGDLLSVVL